MYANHSAMDAEVNKGRRDGGLIRFYRPRRHLEHGYRALFHYSDHCFTYQSRDCLQRHVPASGRVSLGSYLYVIDRASTLCSKSTP